MNEDPTQRFPDESNKSAELLPLIQSIRAELAELKQTVELRLHDTRPIWEKVQADIAQLQEGQQRLEEGQLRLEGGQRQLEEGQEALRKEVREIRTELRDMNRKFSIFNDNLVQIQADYRDIYDRVRDLERQHP
jgi:chromosome segregation ATPase